ncbi:MAG: LVIVD repeat-containing protein [Thermoleophilia bacterium]
MLAAATPRAAAQTGTPVLASGSAITQAISSPTHPNESTWYANNDPVFDWAQPATIAGVYSGAERVNDVAVAGDYAYVAAAAQGLLILNISNPAAPTLAGSFDTPGYANGVEVSGVYAYVADGSGGLQVINIANPAAPTLAGSYDTQDYIYSVSVSGSYAYLIAYALDGSSGLRIINISNPAAPTLTGSLNTPGTAQELVISGNYAYVADWASGLQIINITNPAAPTLAGSYHTPYNAQSVAVSGDYAYVVDPLIGLRILNIANPAAPVLAGSLDTPGWYFHVATIGSYAYLTDGNSGLLEAYDISNPATPSLVSSFDTQGLTREVAVLGDHVFAAAGQDGLTIVDSNLWASYSFVFDQSPDTIPDTVSEGLVTTSSYTDVADGVWYMHLRAADSQGNWGTTTHRRAAVDTIPPAITYTGPTGTTGDSPTVTGTYSESDSLSGINAASAKVKFFSINGFQEFGCTATGGAITCPTSGLTNFSHEATISIADNAGNRVTDSGSFAVSGAPNNLYSAYFPWYDNVAAANWVLMADPYTDGASGTDLFFDLSIGGTPRTLAPLPDKAEGQAAQGDTISARYAGLMAGPVDVGYRSAKTSRSDPQAVISQRILWAGNSLEEVPAITATRLSDHFYWTWYDQQSPGYTNWVLVANPDTDPVYYEITIAGENPGPGSSGTIAPGGNVAPTFPGKMGGPVEVRAWTNATKTAPARVMASQRVLSNYGLAFNEEPGLPAEELASSHLWTWYDQQSPGARDWVLIANPNNFPVYYEIIIAGEDPGPGSSGMIAPGENVTPDFPGRMGGPVQVQTWTGSDKNTQAAVIASQRVIWGPSFDETAGFDINRCPSVNQYHWTWYDQQSPGSTNWVMISNPGNTVADYSIWLGSEELDSGSIDAGATISRTFPGRMGGPVQVRATASVVTSQRVLWNGYFNETPGIVLGCGTG